MSYLQSNNKHQMKSYYCHYNWNSEVFLICYILTVKYLLLNSSNSSANVCRNFKMCYFVINWTVCQCQQVRMLRFRSSTELSRLLSSCLSPICPLVRPASLHSLCLRTAAIYATTGNWSLYINVRSHNLGLKVKTES